MIQLRPTPRPMSPQLASALAEVTHCQDKLVYADLEVRNAVKRARVAGGSWSQIAASLGTTQQAAHQRFRNDDPTAAATEPLPPGPGRARLFRKGLGVPAVDPDTGRLLDPALDAQIEESQDQLRAVVASTRARPRPNR